MADPTGLRNEETVCGTVAGFLRHKHQRTTPCQGCRDEWELFQAFPKNAYRRKKTDNGPKGE